MRAAWAFTCAAILMAGASSGCTRHDRERGQTDEFFTEARREWQARVDQSRQRASEPPPSTETAKPEHPLVEAAGYGDFELVRDRLSSGLDAKTLKDALLMAARSEPLVFGPPEVQAQLDSRFARVVRLLLERGAPVDARDKEGNTPLILAAGYGETAVVKVLIGRGAAIEARNASGATPLILAACMCVIVDLPDTADSVRLLLASGARTETVDNEGRTALMVAAGVGRDTHVNILLDHGAQLEAADNEGNTALMIAARGSGYATAGAVRALLARGASTDRRNKRGRTALALAASGGGSDAAAIVKALTAVERDRRSHR